MFDYYGVTWTPKSTKDHANDILTEINRLIKAGGSLDQITPVIKNILW